MRLCRPRADLGLDCFHQDVDFREEFGLSGTLVFLVDTPIARGVRSR